MLGRFIFKCLSESKKVSALREKGVALGTRIKNGRKAYLYLLTDFCVEVIFRNDDTDLTPEQVTTFGSVKEFNSYLEKEFRATF